MGKNRQKKKDNEFAKDLKTKLAKRELQLKNKEIIKK
jgi:hypothetical protein